jgi:hypothetical protein
MATRLDLSQMPLHKRRSRLPMLLGLAVLTTMAHFLAAAVHMAFHPIGDWPLLLMLAAGPIAAVALSMTAPAAPAATSRFGMGGRPRQSAGLLTIAMALAAYFTLYQHFVVASDILDTFLSAWIVQMMLAFELQGAALGLLLLWKPQVPHPKDPVPSA